MGRCSPDRRVPPVSGRDVARYLVAGPALPEARAERLRLALAEAPSLAQVDRTSRITIWAATEGYLLLVPAFRLSPVRYGLGWDARERRIHCIAHARVDGSTHRFRSGPRMSPAVVARMVERIALQAECLRAGHRPDTVSAPAAPWLATGGSWEPSPA